MQQKSRILALDLLRGAAAFGIVIFHVIGPYYSQLRSLFFLVDFFFLLSGFVLAKAVLIQSWSDLKAFIRRRIQRIFPMAICALIFAESLRLAPLLLKRPGSRDDISSLWNEFGNLIVAILLLQVFSYTSQLLLFPLWSLSAEWLTNIAAALITRVIGKRQIFLFILIGFVMLVIGLFTEWAKDPSAWLVSLARCFLCFGTGQLIYRSIHLSDRSYKSKLSPIWALLAVVLYYVTLNTLGTKALIFAPLPFGYVLWVYGKGDRGFGNVRLKSLSVFSGRYSYGLYVWHIPALGVCDILLKMSGLKLSNQFLLNVFELVGTLVASIFFTFIVLKYVEKAPFARERLNSTSKEIK